MYTYNYIYRGIAHHHRHWFGGILLLGLANVAQANEKHIVIKGDTLWDIAKTVSGNSTDWPKIWKINSFIVDPNKIYPNQTLMLPGHSDKSAVTSSAKNHSKKNHVNDAPVTNMTRRNSGNDAFNTGKSERFKSMDEPYSYGVSKKHGKVIIPKGTGFVVVDVKSLNTDLRNTQSLGKSIYIDKSLFTTDQKGH